MRKFNGEIVALKHTYGFILDNEETYRWFHAKYVKGLTFDDLNIGLAGSTANLTLTFNAVTVEGTTVTTTVFRQLSVESCA